MGTEHPAVEYAEAETGHTVAPLSAVVPVEVVAPVRVEEHPPRSITTDQVPVGLSPVKVAAHRPTRASLTMVCRGTASVRVYLGGHASVTPSTGFLITPDSALTIEASGDVYAVADGTGSTLHLLAQHRDG